MTYEGLDSRITRILETIQLFKDDPAQLKAMLRVHAESIFLEGEIAGIKETGDKL